MKKRTVKYLLFFAVAAAAAFGIYRYAVPDKYEYWNKFIAQDPKPDGVSEKEYREKLRAGYCWRDRKFYTAEELQQKAMVSFSGRLVGETDAYWLDMTTNQGGRAYTSADCARNETTCRVWFVPKGYTNEQWDKLFLAEENSADKDLLLKYLDKEIKQPADLQNYLIQYGSKDYTLIKRHYGTNGGYVYGSDCCKVLSKKEAKPKIKGHNRITYVEDAATFPENDIPEGVKIEDYGVGNFYFEFGMVIPGLYQEDEKNKTYQVDYSEILFTNNCGDVLWQPYYIN